MGAEITFSTTSRSGGKMDFEFPAYPGGAERWFTSITHQEDAQTEEVSPSDYLALYYYPSNLHCYLILIRVPEEASAFEKWLAATVAAHGKRHNMTYEDQWQWAFDPKLVVHVWYEGPFRKASQHHARFANLPVTDVRQKLHPKGKRGPYNLTEAIAVTADKLVLLRDR